MDNFEKLFKEERKNYDSTKMLGQNLESEVLQMKGSEWFKELNMGLQSFKQKNHFTALKYLNQAIRLKSDNAHLYEVRAKIKEDAGDAEGAIQDYKNSLHYRNDAYNIYNQIAINYFRLDQYEKALLAFNIAIELKSSLKEQGLSDEMVPRLVHGTIQSVPLEVMLTNRANAKLSLKDFEGSLDDCELANEINRTYPSTYLIAGLTFLQIDKLNEAIESLKQAENLGNPVASQVLHQLSRQ